MRKSAKRILKDAFHALGLEITRYAPPIPPVIPPGVDPYFDIGKLVNRNLPIIAFDVGGNTGQSVETLKRVMPQCEVHSFEPSPTTYELLAKNAEAYTDVYLNNLAVGSSCTERTFLENVYSDMSSFLEPSGSGWGEMVKETTVQVTTLDRYCEEKNIPYVSILKTDTQGYDFEVLKGATGLMADNRIQLILTEIIFSDMYKGLPAFDEMYRFLLDRRFRLVSFYQFYYQSDIASWTDALFINPSFEGGDAPVSQRAGES